MSHDEFFLSYIKKAKPGRIPLFPYEFKEYHLKRLARFVDVSGDCWNWTSTLTTTGYPCMGIRGKRGGKKAHRLLFSILLNRDLNKKEHLCHNCDNPKCIRPSHLYIGSAKSNVDDMDRRGRRINYWSGRNGPLASSVKYKEKDVRKAIELYAQGKLSMEIEEQTGIKRSTIFKIVKGQMWENLWPFGIGSKTYSPDEIQKLARQNRPKYSLKNLKQYRQKNQFHTK